MLAQLEIGRALDPQVNGTKLNELQTKLNLSQLKLFKWSAEGLPVSY